MGLSGKFAFWDHENEGKTRTTFYVVFLIFKFLLLHKKISNFERPIPLRHRTEFAFLLLHD
jgi:hypothetical protein